jgi:hypothetical protein
LFDAAAAALGFHDPEFAGRCVTGLQEASSADWLQTFSGGVYPRLRRLLSKVAGGGYKVELAESLADALRQYANLLAEGGKITLLSSQDWHALKDCLSDHLLQGVRSEFLKAAVAAGADTTSEFFVLFGPELMQREVLWGEPNLVRSLLTPMVLETRQAGLSWFLGILRLEPQILEGFRKKDVTDLRSALKKVSKYQRYGPKTELVRDIARLLGIKVPKRT